MKVIRRKAKNSGYKMRMNITFTLYCLFMVASTGIFALAYTVPHEQMVTAFWILAGIWAILFLISSCIVALAVIPCFKRAQARKDFIKEDFAPYTPQTASEVLEGEYGNCRLTLTPEPFEKSDFFIMPNDKNTLKKYFGQIAPSRYISQEYFESEIYSSPFYIFYFFGGDGIKLRVEKNATAKYTELDIYDLHRAEFTKDGIIVGSKLYSYNDTQAEIRAEFGHSTKFHVSVRIIILLADEGVLSIKLTSKTAEILKRFPIEVANREVLEYVLSNPLHAYEQTALQLTLRKLK